MFEFSAAAGESDRAGTAHSGRVTVNAEIGRAGQYKAECWQHHMGNALFGIADIEKPKTMMTGRLARCINENAAPKACMGLEGWDRMVLHHHCQISSANCEGSSLQILEHLRRPHVVDHYTVDVKKRLTAFILENSMLRPNFVE